MRCGQLTVSGGEQCPRSQASAGSSSDSCPSPVVDSALQTCNECCFKLQRNFWGGMGAEGLPSAATATVMPCRLPCLAEPQASAKPAQLLCQLPVLPSIPSAACLLSFCRGATWPIPKGRNIRLTCEPLQPWYPGTTTLLLRRETWLDEWEGEGRVQATYIYILHPVLPIPQPMVSLTVSVQSR